MPVEYWLIFILIVMIIASIAALEMEDILSSIVAIGVVGSCKAENAFAFARTCGT